MSESKTPSLIERLQDDAEFNTVNPNFPHAVEHNATADLEREAAAELTRLQAEKDACCELHLTAERIALTLGEKLRAAEAEKAEVERERDKYRDLNDYAEKRLLNLASASPSARGKEASFNDAAASIQLSPEEIAALRKTLYENSSLHEWPEVDALCAMARRCEKAEQDTVEANQRWHARLIGITLERDRADRAESALLQAREDAQRMSKVPLRQIVFMLEASAANTDTDWRWRAASAMRENPHWQSATADLSARQAEPLEGEKG